MSVGTMEGGALSPPHGTSPLTGADATDRIPPTGADAPKLAIRKRPSHMPLVTPVNRAVLVSLTVCTKDRKPILATPEVHATLVHAWTDARRWRVGRYVLLPDHVHLFCAPASEPPEPLAIWVRYWKSRASMHWPCPEQQPVWQADFWDTQLRRDEGYAAKWEYVRHNPVRAGLAARPDDWPHQGELNVLRWYDEQ